MQRITNKMYRFNEKSSYNSFDETNKTSEHFIGEKSHFENKDSNTKKEQTNLENGFIADKKTRRNFIESTPRKQSKGFFASIGEKAGSVFGNKKRDRENSNHAREQLANSDKAFDILLDVSADKNFGDVYSESEINRISLVENAKENEAKDENTESEFYKIAKDNAEGRTLPVVQDLRGKKRQEENNKRMQSMTYVQESIKAYNQPTENRNSLGRQDKMSPITNEEILNQQSKREKFAKDREKIHKMLEDLKRKANES